MLLCVIAVIALGVAIGALLGLKGFISSYINKTDLGVNLEFSPAHNISEYSKAGIIAKVSPIGILLHTHIGILNETSHK